MLKKIRPYVIGFLTYTPLRKRYLLSSTGGTNDARYCYGVFMRHLKYAQRSGMADFPRTIAELGPGDSIGIGLCWLIAGSQQYYAFDVENYTEHSRSLAIFDELVELFEARASLPAPSEHPNLKPKIDDLSFPDSILTQKHMQAALDGDRLAGLRKLLTEKDVDKNADSPIRFMVPWNYEGNIRPGTVDLIYSQAVMEHVEDVESVYQVSKTWLRPGGLISHQIDFTSHGTSPDWDGYRAYSELSWRIVRGSRAYAINRVPASGHIDQIKQHGFRVVNEIPAYIEPTLTAPQYAKRFRELDSESKRTAGLFVQAVL